MLCLTVKQLHLSQRETCNLHAYLFMHRDDANSLQWQGQKYHPQHELANDLRVLLDGGAISISNTRFAHHGV